MGGSDDDPNVDPQKDKDPELCPVCLEPTNGASQKGRKVFDCGHYVCCECWELLGPSTNKCPICRKDIDDPRVATIETLRDLKTHLKRVENLANKYSTLKSHDSSEGSTTLPQTAESEEVQQQAALTMSALMSVGLLSRANTNDLSIDAEIEEMFSDYEVPSPFNFDWANTIVNNLMPVPGRTVFHFTIQPSTQSGQPTQTLTNFPQGQPTDANPIQGRPMEANPVQGQPTETNPFQGQPMEANPIPQIQANPQQSLPYQINARAPHQNNETANTVPQIPQRPPPPTPDQMILNILQSSPFFQPTTQMPTFFPFGGSPFPPTPPRPVNFPTFPLQPQRPFPIPVVPIPVPHPSTNPQQIRPSDPNPSPSPATYHDGSSSV